jgi:hypothetical protein
MTDYILSAKEWISILKKYSDDYSDALTYGGPTIYPQNPLNQPCLSGFHP